MKKPLIAPCPDQVALIGLGPHAKRIYIHFLKKRNALPKLIVELASNEEATRRYLSDQEISADLIVIPDAEKDNQELSPHTRQVLEDAIARLAITKAIISTEPKSHLAYAAFFLEAGVDVLMDKPLSSPVGASSDLDAAKQIYDDYKKLEIIAKKSNKARCVVQCQRRYHPAYSRVREIVSAVIRDYGVPITHLYIYHSDGLWSMPNEYGSRENHPYKYGYGKLMHSGYHFVDLFCWLSELNNQLIDKKPNEIELFHQICEPNDCLFQVNEADYQRLFNSDTLTDFFLQHQKQDYALFGEVDSYTQLQLRRDGQTVLSGGLHLLQNGFSRRAWQHLPEDTYKGNGRIRHEFINLHVGPLLNIQIHCYESHEVADPSPILPASGIGGLEHCDVYVFRNSAMIGGKSFEQLDLVKEQTQTEEYLGHNEAAREQCLADFLDGDNQKGVGPSAVQHHGYTNWLLSLIHQASVQKRQGELPIIAQDLPDFAS